MLGCKEDKKAATASKKRQPDERADNEGRERRKKEQEFSINFHSLADRRIIFQKNFTRTQIGELIFI